jgi:hypothetical protein
MTEAPTINVTARLDLPAPWPGGGPAHTLWGITHGLGTPAAGTFTAVRVPDFTPTGEPLTDATKEAAVLEVARSLYGTAYAFIYRPERMDDGVYRHNLRGREHVTITAVEVWA